MNRAGRAITPTLTLLCVLWASTGAACAAPLPADDWRDLGPKQRYDALQNYWSHEQLPQERQRDIERRYERWRGMPQEERDRVRQNYERFQQLPPKERERFQKKYEKWRQQGEPPK